MIKLNKIRQLLAFFVIMASLTLVGMISYKIYQGRLSKELPRKLPKNIDISLKQVHLTETRDGEKKWDLIAERADYDKGQEVTQLTGVRLVIAGSGGAGDISLTSRRAEYHNVSRDVSLEGGVVAKTASGMELKTDSAKYLADKAVIVSSGKVKFTDGKLTLEGVGMEFKPQTRDFRLNSSVTANLQPGAAK
jgi:LPS export ABC transporter protein LptC